MRRLLNLGCGNKLLAPAEGEEVCNHDRTKHRAEVNCVHDLNVLPWPWPDNTFDYIAACAVLEHLQLNLMESLAECWRILRPGGQIRIKVPYWRHEDAWADVTHYWQFCLGSFDQFDPDTKRGKQYAFYTPFKWQIVTPARYNPDGTSIIITMQVRK